MTIDLTRPACSFGETALPYHPKEFRVLFCWDCNDWTDHRRIGDERGSFYVCRDCGAETIHFIVVHNTEN